MRNAHDIEIQRCPHDAENPYVLINRDLIRDSSISPACRWFISYCLSMNADWKINIEFLREKQGISKDAIYRYVKEAIKAGYIKRIEYFVKDDKNRKLKRYRYIISEKPRYREENNSSENGRSGPKTEEKSQLPEIQDTEIQDTEIQDTEKQDSIVITKEDVSLKKERNIKERKTPPSADAASLLEFFNSSLSKNIPEIMSHPKDTKAFEALLKNYRLEQIEAVITFAHESDFWRAHVHTPHYLKLKFAKLLIASKREIAKTKEDIAEDNKQWAKEFVTNYLRPSGFAMEFCAESVEYGAKDHPRRNYLSFKENGFKDQFYGILMLNKCKPKNASNSQSLPPALQ